MKNYKKLLKKKVLLKSIIEKKKKKKEEKYLWKTNGMCMFCDCLYMLV